MSALMIKDLSVNEALGSKAMKAVRGGFAPYLPGFKLDIDNSKSVSAQQLVSQGVTINNMSDNNNAFAAHLPTTLTTNVHGNNNVTVF